MGNSAIDLDEDIDFGEDDFVAPPEVKRGPGRPKNIGTETVITKRQLTEPADGEESDPIGPQTSPIFDFTGGNSAKDIVKIRVTRLDPNNGVVGYLDDLTADETAISERFGGGTYRVDGVDGRNKIAKRATLKIAGDPIFSNEADEIAWRRAKGLGPKLKSLSDQPSMQEMLSIVDAREEKRRQEERELDEKRRREDREYQDRIRQQEKEWNAEQAQRRKDDEDRRRREDEDRERRRREDDSKAQQQQQMFMTQMITMVQSQATQSISFVKETVAASLNNQPKGDASEMLLKGVQLALQLKEMSGGGDGGEKDILQTVVENLPAMLNGIGNAASKVAREIKGVSGNQQNPSPSLSAQPGQTGGLALPAGPLSDKLGALVQRIAASGNDPEVELGKVVDHLLKATDPKPVATVKNNEIKLDKPAFFDKGAAPAEAKETTVIAKENPEVQAPPLVSVEDVENVKGRVTSEKSVSGVGVKLKLGRE